MTAGMLLTHAARSIFRNRIRSLLTSLGIIIGVGSVIVMVAVGQGSQQQIRQQIASMGTNMIMVMPPRGRREANRLTTADVAKLRAESSYLSAISGIVRRQRGGRRRHRDHGRRRSWGWSPTTSPSSSGR